MNFFEHQYQARQRTFRLLCYYAVGCFLFILSNMMLVFGVFHLRVWDRALTTQDKITLFFQQFGNFILSPDGVISFGFGLCIVGAISLVRYWKLSQGGGAVARALGGKKIRPDVTEFRMRQLMNIVEEMSLAANIPMPEVYVLPGNHINAFAAGSKIDNAAIGVTKGTLRRLNRDQLQGVIAHEFSHILNGDMVVNMRMESLLAGILFIAQIGFFMLRSGTAFVGKNRKDNRLMILALGFVVLGLVGVILSKIIQSAVSRQREFLADASAVQFTRNPNGISSALKLLIAEQSQRSDLPPKSADFSYMFFSETSFLRNILSTHPPLEERIRRIEPAWDGSIDDVIKEAKRYEAASRRRRVKEDVLKTENTGASSAKAPASIADQIWQ